MFVESSKIIARSSDARSKSQSATHLAKAMIMMVRSHISLMSRIGAFGDRPDPESAGGRPMMDCRCTRLAALTSSCGP